MSEHERELLELFEDDMRAEGELMRAEQEAERAERLRDAMREDGEVV